MIILKSHTTNNVYQFDPFDPRTILGEGATSIVFKGYDLSNNRPVAIKVLRYSLSRNPVAIRRLYQEASVQIDHPNLLKIYDFIEHDNKYHLITEYLEGRNLEDFIQAPQRANIISPVEIYKIINSILNGLEALHHHEPPIVHRDIKPSNVFYCKDDVIKIMDYGIMKVVKKKGYEKLTHTDTMLGTFGYASPEQIQGLNDKVSSSSDLYAVGVILYELLAGHTPFAGINTYKKLEKQVKGQLDPANIDSRFWPIIKKATQVKPNKRFKNTAQFRQSFNALYNAEKQLIESTPSTINQKWLIGLGIPVLLIIAILILNNWPPPTPITTPTDSTGKSGGIASHSSSSEGNLRIKNHIDSSKLDSLSDNLKEQRRINSLLWQRKEDSLKQRRVDSLLQQRKSDSLKQEKRLDRLRYQRIKQDSIRYYLNLTLNHLIKANEKEKKSLKNQILSHFKNPHSIAIQFRNAYKSPQKYMDRLSFMSDITNIKIDSLQFENYKITYLKLTETRKK